MRNILIAAAGAAVLLAMPALARESAWMSVGTRPITAETTSQTLTVSGLNVPREAMFCVDDAPAQIVSVDFRYGDGTTETLTPRARIRRGDCSRTFSLRNRTGELASVSVTVDPASLTAGGTARIRILVR